MRNWKQSLPDSAAPKPSRWTLARAASLASALLPGSRSTHRNLALAGLLLAAGISAAAEPTTPQSPREFYNDGTQHLRDDKLREAESSLQMAVASNDERVQPPALYNLAHVRFKQGVEALKDAPDAQAAKARGDTANALGGKALQDAEAALAGGGVEAITRAYMQGRGARKQLTAAMDAVKKAMEAHGLVLRRWQRASGDFKSAYELRPALADAQSNAEAVDHQIAALVDQQEQMQQCMKSMGGKKDDLKKKMQELKKKMPEGAQKQGMGEEDDDEDNKDQPPKEPQMGDQEKQTQEGQRMELTREEAMRLLESLKLDANRKLSMGDKESGNPKDRKGKDW